VRIGLVIYGSLDLVSGGFLYDRMVVRELRALGAEVSVLALPWRRYGGALADNLAPWPPLDGIDVLVEDELVHPSVFARRPPGVPVVALVHNLGVPPGTPSLRAAIERRYFARVDGVIAVCENTLREARALGAPPGVVARAGRDHLAPRVSARAPGPLRLLFVGTVMRHKGLHRLLTAVAALPPQSWTLDVVGNLTGDPAYAEACKRGAPPGVRWHGQLNGDALWAQYAAADLFVLPSDREAYSIACLEALGFGLPVLVTDRGGMSEMIGPTQGLTLSPDDTQAWSAALRALAGDRARLVAMSAAARARYEQHGSWRDTASVIDRFLTGLLARSSR
jgi:glycosyltransferase involved in cell wall biosynthesis